MSASKNTGDPRRAQRQKSAQRKNTVEEIVLDWGLGRRGLRRGVTLDHPDKWHRPERTAKEQNELGYVHGRASKYVVRCLAEYLSRLASINRQYRAVVGGDNYNTTAESNCA